MYRFFQKLLAAAGPNFEILGPDFSIRASMVEPGIARVHFDRALRGNALSLVAYRELASAFSQVGQNSNVRVILFTTEGPNFGTGADTSYLETLTSHEAAQQFSLEINQVAQRIEEVAMRIPVIAAIPQRVQGGMSHLVLAMTERVVGDVDEVLREPGFYNFGIMGGGGGIPRLVRHLAHHFVVEEGEGEAYGLRRAMAEAFRILVLESDKFIGGEELRSVGLAADVAPLTKILDEAVKLARKTIENPHYYRLVLAAHRLKMQRAYREEYVRRAQMERFSICRATFSGNPERYEVATKILWLMAQALTYPLGEAIMNFEAKLFADVFTEVGGPKAIAEFRARHR